MTNQNRQEALQTGDDLVSGVGAAEEVGQEDEVILTLRSDKPNLFKECCQTVEDCRGESGVKRESLNKKMVSFLQRCHCLNDGSNQSYLVLLFTFFIEHILGICRIRGQEQNFADVQDVRIDLGQFVEAPDIISVVCQILALSLIG